VQPSTTTTGVNPQLSTLNTRETADHRPGVEYRRPAYVEVVRDGVSEVERVLSPGVPSTWDVAKLSALLAMVSKLQSRLDAVSVPPALRASNDKLRNALGVASGDVANLIGHTEAGHQADADSLVQPAIDRIAAAFAGFREALAGMR
jgi:hypothetical protein